MPSASMWNPRLGSSGQEDYKNDRVPRLCRVNRWRLNHWMFDCCILNPLQVEDHSIRGGLIYPVSIVGKTPYSIYTGLDKVRHKRYWHNRPDRVWTSRIVRVRNVMTVIQCSLRTVQRTFVMKRWWDPSSGLGQTKLEHVRCFDSRGIYQGYGMTDAVFREGQWFDWRNLHRGD